MGLACAVASRTPFPSEWHDSRPFTDRLVSLYTGWMTKHRKATATASKARKPLQPKSKKPTAAHHEAPSQGMKERIIRVVNEILIEEGPGALSVDHVIAKAGISKGGFFHHFKSKDDLMLAILENHYPKLVDALLLRSSQDRNPQGSLTRAWIAIAISRNSPEFEKSIAFARALMLCLSQAPKTVARYRDLNMAYLRGLGTGQPNSGMPKGLDLVLNLALDGLWLGEALGIYGMTDAEHAQVMKEISALSEGV